MRINIINGIIAIVAISTIILTGCSKDKNLLSEQTEGPSKTSYSEPADEMILGNKIDNPYSVANMSIAYSNLINKANNGKINAKIDQNVVIETTHLYIRIKPQDSTEYQYLIDKSGLELFTYPLDYEIIQLGNYYECPNLAPGEFPYFYTSVHIKEVSQIQLKFETLEECYIPDENEIGEETAFLLELEAMLVPELITVLEYDEALNNRGSKRPEGYIKVKNTSTKKYEGVKKIKIRVHNVVKWDAVYTNEDGYYKMDKSWLTQVHYAAIFENSTGFKIWGNCAFFAPANYQMGWHTNSGHSRDFDTGSQGWLWSAINNAAYIYREKMCPDYNISKPPSDLRVWAYKMNGEYDGCAPMARRFPFSNTNFILFLQKHNVTVQLNYILLLMPDIFILQDFKNTKKCYAAVFHELAHASHFQKATANYWKHYVNATINNGAYGNATDPLAGFIGIGEIWGYYIEWKCMNNKVKLGFTEFEDVPLDETVEWFKPKLIKELEVSRGLSVKQIFDCLKWDIYTCGKLKTELINAYASNNPTLQTKIINAFNSYGF